MNAVSQDTCAEAGTATCGAATPRVTRDGGFRRSFGAANSNKERP